jgi:hypothetical protein
MSRYYPVLSECTLEDCGAYERFQVNKVQVYHRYAMSGDVTWMHAFENLEGVEKLLVEMAGGYHHWYSSHTKLWYINQHPMGQGSRPTIETWYQDYLKSRAATIDPPALPISH